MFLFNYNIFFKIAQHFCEIFTLTFYVHCSRIVKVLRRNFMAGGTGFERKGYNTQAYTHTAY